LQFAWFIVKKLALNPSPSFSRFIIRIAVAAVALSLTVMIVATSMVRGFQKEIKQKVYGFWGHIHVTKFNADRKQDAEPLSIQRDFYPSLEDQEGIEHVQAYANKAGIIKSNEQIEGIILKGVAPDFNWQFFREYLVAGEIFQVTDTSAKDQVVISRYTADRLHLEVGDPFLVYFIQDPPRVRKLTISGIYDSGLGEFDKFYALVDIGHIRDLNGWEEDQVGGFEVFIDDVEQLQQRSDDVYKAIGPDLYAESIQNKIPNIFDWLQLQNTNEVVILVLMVLVASINMISVLLILILERTNMIGILKAFGATNWTIRKVFILNAAYIIGLGLVWGNVLGLGICFIQDYFEVITLPQKSYYVSVAPIYINPLNILLVNAGTLVICTLSIVMPTYLVSRINPIKAIRFS